MRRRRPGGLDFARNLDGRAGMTTRSMLPEHQQTTAYQLVALIDSHRFNPIVVASPLRTILPMLRQYIAETEARISRLERERAGK